MLDMITITTINLVPMYPTRKTHHFDIDITTNKWIMIPGWCGFSIQLNYTVVVTYNRVITRKDTGVRVDNW